MAVTKTQAEIVTAATTVAASLNAANQSDAGNLQAARALFAKVEAQYIKDISAAPTKTASGADAAALWTAASITDGLVWIAAGTGDTTDTLLATAKGSAPAAGNVFQRVGSAVIYVGASKLLVTGLTAALAELAT